MGKLFCPMQKRDMFNDCYKADCAWWDKESKKCSIAELPAALDLFTRFMLTPSYPPSPDNEDD